MKQNSFIESFKKLGNIEKLTRPLVLEFIYEILIHEGERITIILKCREAFDQASEYIEINNDNIKTVKEPPVQFRQVCTEEYAVDCNRMMC